MLRRKFRQADSTLVDDAYLVAWVNDVHQGAGGRPYAESTRRTRIFRCADPDFVVLALLECYRGAPKLRSRKSEPFHALIRGGAHAHPGRWSETDCRVVGDALGKSNS